MYFNLTTAEGRAAFEEYMYHQAVKAENANTSDFRTIRRLHDASNSEERDTLIMNADDPAFEFMRTNEGIK